jgi:hypothetical protein
MRGADRPIGYWVHVPAITYRTTTTAKGSIHTHGGTPLARPNRPTAGDALHAAHARHQDVLVRSGRKTVATVLRCDLAIRDISVLQVLP